MKRARRLRRGILRLLLGLLASLVIAAAVFERAASRAQPNFRPINAPMSAEQKSLVASIPKYARPEESTYLTFPEWYLVFNPQEYGQYLTSGDRPSGFPYFRSIGQFWSSYAQVYGITKRHFPFNIGDHLMEAVIGTSFTLEYLVKGVYENSIGRISEWLGGARTEEDAYAAKMAREYGDFIPTRPWFEFPFGHALGGLWSSNSFFGKHFLRKCERKFFLSFEYGAKAIYAGLIRLASHAVYGVADTEIYATLENVSAPVFEIPGVKKIRELEDGACVVSLPHYQGFTDTAPALARTGVEFRDLAGNDEILLTVVAPTEWKYDLPQGSLLFTMEMMNTGATKRFAVQAPVHSLGAMLRAFETRGIKIEHLFDY